MRQFPVTIRDVNFNELAYDSALLIFPFLLARAYDPAMRTTVFGIPFLVYFLLCAVYFLPVLIGRMYNAEYRDSSPVIKKSLIFIACSGTLFAYGSLLSLTIKGLAAGENAQVLIFISATVLLIMGPIAGIITSPDTDKGEEISSRAGVFLFTLGVLPLFFILVSGEQIFGDINGILVLLLIVFLMFADALFVALIFGLYILCRKLLVRLGLLNAARITARLLIPFCISFIMVFFNIYCDRFILGGVHTRGTGTLILIVLFYLVTGIIPLRILMMLAPPVRPANILMGVFSVSVMVYLIAVK